MIDHALDALLETIEKETFGKAARPRAAKVTLAMRGTGAGAGETTRDEAAFRLTAALSAAAAAAFE